MRIKLKTDSKKNYFVFGIYWTIYKDRWLRHYFVIDTEDGFPGFSILVEDEAFVSDSNISGYILTKDGSGNDMLLSDLVIEPKGLLNDLIHHESYESLKLLLSKVRSIGLEVDR